MLSRLVSVMMLVMFCAQIGACTRPDDRNYTAMVKGVEDLTPNQRWDLWQWTNNQESTRYLKGFAASDEVFRMRCNDGRESPPVTVTQILECLAQDEHKFFWWCVDTFFDEYDGDYGGCAKIMAPGFREGEIPDEWADSGIRVPELDDRVALPDADTLIIALIKSVKPPPKWLWPALGLIVVGGAIVGVVAAGPIVSLCALAGPEHWSCPASPLYPGQQRPTGDNK